MQPPDEQYFFPRGRVPFFALSPPRPRHPPEFFVSVCPSQVFSSFRIFPDSLFVVLTDAAISFHPPSVLSPRFDPPEFTIPSLELGYDPPRCCSDFPPLPLFISLFPNFFFFLNIPPLFLNTPSDLPGLEPLPPFFVSGRGFPPSWLAF